LQTTTVGHADYVVFRGAPTREVGYASGPDTSKGIPRAQAIVREIDFVRQLIRDQFGDAQ
jgi:hypothetical protein